MPTPNGASIYVHHPDGELVEITEGVQVLYDLVTASMDWGSGFLSIEDVAPMLKVSDACGFGEDDVRDYITSRRRDEILRDEAKPYDHSLDYGARNQLLKELREDAWRRAKAQVDSEWADK